MTDPRTQLALSHLHISDLQAKAAAHRRAAQTKPARELRTRIGWTLVEVGLRLATPAPASAPL